MDVGILIVFRTGLPLVCHYANMSVQYTAIFHGCKNDNFQMIFLIFFLFLLKTKIVGTRSNRLSKAVLTSTHNLCFGAKIRKICIPE